MHPALATIALGPLLLTQGARVRRVMPRLPEAAGERAGSLGSGPPLRVLVAGDSAAAGVGAASQAQALSGQLAALLSRHYRVSWRLLAQSGLDTAQIHALLRDSPAEPFDVALLSAGVNDVTGSARVGRWLDGLERVLGVLRERFACRSILVSALPPMHHFHGLPQPLRWYLGTRAQHFNAHLARHLPRHRDCVLLTPAFPLDPQGMASDGFHPGPPLYSVWAEHAAAAIREGCVPLAR